MKPIDIIFYTTSTGKQPFADWQKDLDTKTESIVLARLSRLRSGNVGDCKQIKGGNGICELRINHGAGYRIYFGKKGAEIVVLLVGGDKGSQNRDIEKAKRYWLDFKEQKHG
jgi:putative addiction module killer protein